MNTSIDFPEEDALNVIQPLHVNAPSHGDAR